MTQVVQIGGPVAVCGLHVHFKLEGVVLPVVEFGWLAGQLCKGHALG